MGASSNGKTAGLHPADEGSTPSAVHCCPGGERDITAPSEGAGPGSTPGRGTGASVVKRTSRGRAKAEVLVRLRAEALNRGVLLGGQRGSNPRREGSTPSAPADGCVCGRSVQAPARQAGQVGSIPTRRSRHPRGPAATAPRSHRGDRRFESCRGYCGVDWRRIQHGLISRPTPVRVRPPQLPPAGATASARRTPGSPGSPDRGRPGRPRPGSRPAGPRPPVSRPACRRPA